MVQLAVPDRPFPVASLRDGHIEGGNAAGVSQNRHPNIRGINAPASLRWVARVAGAHQPAPRPATSGASVRARRLWLTSWVCIVIGETPKRLAASVCRSSE